MINPKVKLVKETDEGTFLQTIEKTCNILKERNFEIENIQYSVYTLSEKPIYTALIVYENN